MTSTAPPTPRLVLADPDPLARRLVRERLKAAGFTVVADVGDGRDAVELCRHYRPDLLVTELDLPGSDGVAVTRRVCELSAATTVVVLSAATAPDRPLEALRAGAAGFLPKDGDPDDLPRVLRLAAAGEALIPRALGRALLDDLRRVPDHGWRPLHSQLTTREWEVVELLGQGASTQDIAAKLFLSPATVYSHIKNLVRKLGASSRDEAVRAAERLRPAEMRRAAA